MYLTQEQANNKRLISELAGQVLCVPIITVERLGGVISYNYEINHRHIFKLPSGRTNPDDWLRQAQYMPTLQNHLSFEIPAPKAKTVYTPENTSLISLSYPKIKGMCIENPFAFAQKDLTFKYHYFEELSDAANEIHSIPITSLPLELPTKQDIFTEYFFKSFLKKEGSYLEKKLFDELIHDPDLGLGESIFKTSLLAHSDLHSGNVVLNDKNNIVAILDFDALGRGDRFHEFRPKLYTEQQDINLFQEIYSKRTKHPINPKDINNFYQFYDSIGWFACVAQLYDCAIQTEQKHFLQEFNKMFSLMKSIKKTR